MVKNQGLPIPFGNIMIYDYNVGLPMKIKINSVYMEFLLIKMLIELFKSLKTSLLIMLTQIMKRQQRN